MWAGLGLGRCGTDDRHTRRRVPLQLVAGVSFVFYIVAGIIQNVWISLPLACAGMVAVLVVMKRAQDKKLASRSTATGT